MEKLNGYLQQLLNTNGLELHLEPNKNPYITTADGQVDAATAPLPGTQINSMIFALIPDDVKQQLPNQPEIDFVHPHSLGSFGFNVKKSPSGFNVTIAPAQGIPAEQNQEEVVEEQPAVTVNAAPEVPEAETVSEPSPSPEPAEAAQPEVPPTEHVETSQPAFDDVAQEYTLENTSEEQESPSPDVAGVENMFESYDSGAIEVEVEGSDTGFQTESSQPEPVVEPTPEAVNFTANPVVEQTAAEEVIAEPQEPVQPVTPSVTPDVVAPSAPEVETQAHVQSSFTPANPNDRSEMDSLFQQMAAAGASDLHLSVSMPPVVRKDGKMQELAPGAAKLTPESIEKLLVSIMPDKNREEFAERNDTDFAYEIPGLARFRANVFRDRKGMGGVFRIIPSDIMTAEDLNLSKAIMDLTELSKGLVVVTGPTGSGKSTTLCAMVDSINKNREDHIITIEDPIEFTHENIKCLVNQREVHNHTDSFKDALRAALREDPDILLVGEMRDLETISIAIETAETGHLVFGTLHTTTAASTVDRIIDQFPADRQQQIRVMLSESLKGVIAQTLLPKIGGGRVAALEVLIVTPAIANLIREGKTFQIPSQMQTGKNLGMRLLNDSLIELVNKGLVEPKDAYIKAVDKESFEALLQRSGKKI